MAGLSYLVDMERNSFEICLPLSTYDLNAAWDWFNNVLYMEFGY